jgi:hypothetical protein
MYNKYFTMKKSQLKEAIKAEITSVLSEDFNDDNRGLAYIKSDGERDGFESFTQYAGKQNLKNVPDLEAYAEGFTKGVMQKGNKLAQLVSRATRGGADAEPLMKMIGLKEAKSAADVDKEVKDLENKMVEKAKEYKAAEGEKKEKIKDELKDMTTKRNDLKKKVEDLKKKEEKEAEDIGRGQELDT